MLNTAIMLLFNRMEVGPLLQIYSLFGSKEILGFQSALP